jgi:hypothetical protein
MKAPTDFLAVFGLLILILGGCSPQTPTEEVTAMSVEVPNEGPLHINVTPTEGNSLRSAANAAHDNQPVTITVDKGSLKGALEEPAPELRPRQPQQVEGLIKSQAPGMPASVKVRISPEAMSLIRARQAQ